MAPQELVSQAVEDYDLALSRLAWARDCGCRLAGEQIDAMAWHTAQCEETLAAMEALRSPSFVPEQFRSSGRPQSTELRRS